MIADILIGLGSNQSSKFGNPEKTLQRAVARLSDLYDVIAVSPFYRSAPLYFEQQDWFVNGVVAINSNALAMEVLETLQGIEKEFGRLREIENGPRTLDLDILDYKGQVLDAPNLTLPHPGIHERAFVLYPLADIAPSWVHPQASKSVQEMIQALPKGQGLGKIDSESVAHG